MGSPERQQRFGMRVGIVAGVVLLAVISLSMAAAMDAVSESPGQSSTGPLAQGQSPNANQSTQEFNVTIFEDVAGQVATEDASVGVRGTATGTDSVLVTLFDRRGRVATELVSVNDGVFEEDEVELVTADGTPLSEGPVVATVLSPGRDGVVGDGEVSGVTRESLSDFEAGFLGIVRQESGDRPVRRTQQQLVELFYDQTVDDAGSDDLLLVEEFAYTDGRTTIERVYPRTQVDRTGPEQGNRTGAVQGNRTAPVEPIRVGDTLVVQGLTNRKPGDNTLFVEVVEGPTAGAFDLAATRTWGTDGVWQVELDAVGVEPGVYTIEAEDGDFTDSFEVRILPRANESVGNATSTTPAR